jgi:hypothetical protein
MKTVLMRIGLLAAGLTYAAGVWALLRVAPFLAEVGLPTGALPVIGWLWSAAALLLLAGAALLGRVSGAARTPRVVAPTRTEQRALA